MQAVRLFHHEVINEIGLDQKLVTLIGFRKERGFNYGATFVVSGGATSICREQLYGEDICIVGTVDLSYWEIHV